MRKAGERGDSMAEGLPRAPRILLAEDDLELRRLLASELRRDGYEVVECRDGADLLARIERHDPPGGGPEIDLILSDIRMPGLTGIEILELLRTRDPFTPVILVSAFATEGLRAEALRLGASRLFDKPFDVDALRAAVRDEVCPA